MRTPAIVLCLIFAARTRAQDDLRVLPDNADTRKMLYNYLLKECQKQFDARRKLVAGLKAPEEIRKRQADLRAKFVAALGGFPQKTPLNARVVGKLQGDGFHVEKVIYESQPDHHVTANLYLPKRDVPVPGVLLPCGHSANGKAAEAYQRAAILMAKNGLAVLCYDPIGQGERVQLLNNEGKPAIAGSTSEHTMVGIGALLVGKSTASYRIWDGVRGLDYLESRSEIDSKRLGCTGNSGGGTLTAYLMALDDRIVAAAPSCYITSLEKLFATIGPQDAEQNITGQVAFGMEHADYLTMRAPKPTLMCVATRDFFNIDGAWASFREAKLMFGKLGHGERVSIFEYDDKHGFSKPRREAAMRWMRRWLLNKDDAPVEGNFPVFTDAQLQCTRSGQVLEDFKGKSVFHLNALMAQDCARKRDKNREFAKVENLKITIQRLTRSQPQSKRFKVEKTGQMERQGYTIVKRIYETEPGILIPALEFIPDKTKKSPLVVYLHGRGMTLVTGPGGPIEKRVEKGQRVLALDLRGMGETAPAIPPKGKPNYFGVDSKEAFLSLHLSRPLLGQRLDDLLCVLKSNPDQEIHLIGVESAGPIALHATFLEPRIRKLTLVRSLVSWSNVVENPISYNQLANLVPGVLEHYDLPYLEATLATAGFPLSVQELVDGRQRPQSR
jgi:cephalosporin-C deacetylase-like acetyl esterase